MEKKHKINVIVHSNIENRLEKFSDSWNDCPEVQNPMQTSNSYIKYEKEYNYNLKLNSLKERPANESKLINSANGSYSQPNKSDRTLVDLKRKMAVEDKRRQHLNEKNIIKQALSSMDKSKMINNKIIFGENGGYEEKNYIKNSNQNKATQNHKAMLFDDDDNETQSNLELKINHQFKGKTGQKLLELQSKYASDSRFSLDLRFYESGSEESGKETEENTEQSNEIQKQLAILESLVQREIKPLSEIKNKSKLKSADMFLRFDPRKDDHSKYVRKLKESSDETIQVENTASKKKKRKGEMHSAETKTPTENKTVVTIEKVFNIKEDFKKALKSGSGSGFSLLKLFGFEELDDNVTDEYEALDVKKKKPKTGKSFKYESSDSETQNKLKTGPRINLGNSKDHQESPSKPFWEETFFMADGEARLLGVFEFIKSANEEKEFGEKRKVLKQFFQIKYKNNQRKKKMLMKKLVRLQIKK